MKKISVIIAGKHQTSISIEQEFLDELKMIAMNKNLTINELVTQIDATKNMKNLSSAIRIFVLREIKARS